MPKPLSLILTAEQRRALDDARTHHPKPHMREKAAALLKVADGASARQVAANGLLVRRRYETISRWVTRFVSLGLEGLSVRTGRGRKPAFSPSVRDTRAGTAGGPRRDPSRP